MTRSPEVDPEQKGVPAHLSSKGLYKSLILLYLQGSAVALVLCIFLAILGLEFTGRQWLIFLAGVSLAVPAYVGLDIFVMTRHYRPLGILLSSLEKGETPNRDAITAGLVRALNLPIYSGMRVTFLHGPVASLMVGTVLWGSNAVIDGDFAAWQIVLFIALILFFASPAHAIFEFFAIARRFGPTTEQLWIYCNGLDERAQSSVISIRLKSKLLYFCIFITTLPLVFLAGSVVLKLNLMTPSSTGEVTITPVLPWIFGVSVLCIVGAVTMSYLLASEVSQSATKLTQAMKRVEQGVLDIRLPVTGTDEYADLFRGFNLMTEGLRDEVEILGISNDLCGEVNLDRLIARVMRATTDLLDADRSTLFLHDRKTDELCSRFAESIEKSVIRVPSDAGIAGSVFTTGKLANVTDPDGDPRFNSDIDRKTGYKTESILCLPIINKKGERIGVTQVLNKKEGTFTKKDEARLRAFTAQIAVALENARLFEDVINIKNYNESILGSTADGIITLNDDGKIVTANRASLSILDANHEDVVEKTADQFFAGENEWVLKSLEKVRDERKPAMAVDADLETVTGKTLSVNLTVAPLLSLAKEALGTVLVLEDMTGEKRLKTTMSRYMSKEVAEKLLDDGEAQLGGQSQKVSVLFSDIRGFTTISEEIGPRETVSMLNQYFATMVDVIFKHHGILDKYIGDAIMALFGAPFHGPADADNAVIVANEMMVMLRELNIFREKAGDRSINIGVGISTGDVVVGNIGSPKRLEYTDIGEIVKLS